MQVPSQLSDTESRAYISTLTHNIAAEEYHSKKEYVSSTGLRKLLKSPATFIQYLSEEAEESDAMKLGSLVHMAVLEPARYQKCCILQPHFGDLRSTKNKEERDKWKSSLMPYNVVIRDEDRRAIEGIVNSIEKHPDAFKLVRSGYSELTGLYVDPITGIKCKIRPDCFSQESSCLVDLKTTQDCTYSEFQKTIWNYRYDIQMAMYEEGLKHITQLDSLDSIFIAVEKVPPYEVGVYSCDEGLMSSGRAGYRWCLDRLSGCLMQNKWDAYQVNMGLIGLPSWASKNY